MCGLMRKSDDADENSLWFLGSEIRGEGLSTHRDIKTALAFAIVSMLPAAVCFADGVSDKDSRRLLGSSYRVSEIVAGTTPGDEAAARLCHGFSLSESALRRFLEQARPVSAAELHDRFDGAPCYVRAILTTKGHRAELEILASGSATLRMDDRPMERFVCEEKCDALLALPPMAPR